MIDGSIKQRKMEISMDIIYLCMNGTIKINGDLTNQIGDLTVKKTCIVPLVGSVWGLSFTTLILWWGNRRYSLAPGCALRLWVMASAIATGSKRILDNTWPIWIWESSRWSGAVSWTPWGTCLFIPMFLHRSSQAWQLNFPLCISNFPIKKRIFPSHPWPNWFPEATFENQDQVSVAWGAWLGTFCYRGWSSHDPEGTWRLFVPQLDRSSEPFPVALSWGSNLIQDGQRLVPVPLCLHLLWKRKMA